MGGGSVSEWEMRGGGGWSGVGMEGVVREGKGGEMQGRGEGEGW